MEPNSCFRQLLILKALAGQSPSSAVLLLALLSLIVLTRLKALSTLFRSSKSFWEHRRCESP
jgi:hypothetical protein